MADFFIAQIPRPTLLGGEINDFFDVRGLKDTYEELRRLYSILGIEDKVQLFIGPNTHGYNKEARENMYRFFNKHADIEASPTEPDIPVEKDENLQVTSKGQVHLMDSATTFGITSKVARDLAEHRQPVSGKALVEKVVQHLALPERKGPPHYRVLRQRVVWTKPTLRQHGFMVETEPGVLALLHAVVKSGAVYYFPEAAQATLYVPHRSSLQEIILGQAPAVPDGGIQFAVDVRGMGELTGRTQKDDGDDFFHYYHSDYMYANHGLMLSEPYCGRRVYDLLRVLDLCEWNGYREIHLVGRGMGAITAAFAAIVHPVVKQVTLHNALLSYHELTQTERYAWPLSAMVFDVLHHFDLSDCLRELAAAKELTIIDPWDSQMRLWEKDKLQEHLPSLGLDKVGIRWSGTG
jgi:pimeloyl-ACP methyl ester carboxylesterase